MRSTHTEMRTMKNERDELWSRLLSGCNALLFLQEELQPVVSSTTVTGPSSLLYFYQTLLSLSLLLREQSLDMRRKSQQDPNCPASAPQTQVCVCVCMRGVKAPCLHSCLGLGPSPCLPRPEARPVALAEPGERNTGGRGGVIRRAGDCCIFLW